MAVHNALSEVKVVSYNMHGYNQGSVLLPTLCKDFKIIFIQEHWLLPVDLDKIVEITNDEFVCFSKSAMDNRICRGVLAGRPYGGVSTLVHKSLSTIVKCVAKRDRFIVLTIGDIVYVNVYLPVRKSDNVYTSVCSRILLLLWHRLDLIKWSLMAISIFSVMCLLLVSHCFRNVLRILI